MKPVIVFTGRNEFEAQMARDILTSAGIPVLHVPALTTGIFGMRQDTRVAVPEEQAPDAVEVLTEAGFTAGPEPPPRGLDEFRGAFRQAFPERRGRPSLALMVGVDIFGWGLILLIRRILASS